MLGERAGLEKKSPIALDPAAAMARQAVEQSRFAGKLPIEATEVEFHFGGRVDKEALRIVLISDPQGTSIPGLVTDHAAKVRPASEPRPIAQENLSRFSARDGRGACFG